MDVKRSDLRITHVRGSGPGGQNRNKRFSGVRLEHLPSGLVVTATERRSQAQNLSAAWDRLRGKLEALHYRAPIRIPTQTPRSSKRQRLEHKRFTGERKQGRKKVDWPGD